MVIFNSYVKLPEGISNNNTKFWMFVTGIYHMNPKKVMAIYPLSGTALSNMNSGRHL